MAMARFALTDQEEFLATLKYPECGHCGSTMFCRWGCMRPQYPQGLADYEHPMWEEVIEEYIEYYEANNIKSDNLAEHVRKAKLELARRKDGES